jgi:hypothetical protein
LPSLLLIGSKKLAGGIYLQNTRDELQNIEFNQSSAKARQKLYQKLYQIAAPLPT